MAEHRPPAGRLPATMRPLAGARRIGDAARPMDTQRDPNELVSVEHAATLTGIPARTLRNWIAAGQLPAMAGPRSKLLRLGDVVDAAADHGRPIGQPASQPVAGGRPAMEELRSDSDRNSGTVAASARSQLESIRDEWLQPLIDQIAEKSELIGALRTERNLASAARDAAERACRDDASQADQLVNLLEDRIRELERRLQGNDRSGA